MPIMQMSLLEERLDASVHQIPGLTYIPNFITPAEEAVLLNTIDQQPWLATMVDRS